MEIPLPFELAEVVIKQIAPDLQFYAFNGTVKATKESKTIGRWRCRRYNIKGSVPYGREIKAWVHPTPPFDMDTYNNLIAARFADQKRLYAYVKWRDGPEHDDFTEPQELVTEPSEEWRFLKPVALLTNRRVFSSAEDFVLAMRVFPHVTVIGDITGGGAGNPIHRELPNGWVYRLSRWQELTPEMEMYEGIGLMPDVLVGILDEDLAAGRDTILETAIATLEFFFN